MAKSDVIKDEVVDEEGFKTMKTKRTQRNVYGNEFNQSDMTCRLF